MLSASKQTGCYKVQKLIIDNKGQSGPDQRRSNFNTKINGLISVSYLTELQYHTTVSYHRSFLSKRISFLSRITEAFHMAHITHNQELQIRHWSHQRQRLYNMLNLTAWMNLSDERRMATMPLIWLQSTGKLQKQSSKLIFVLLIIIY